MEHLCYYCSMYILRATAIIISISTTTVGPILRPLRTTAWSTSPLIIAISRWLSAISLHTSSVALSLISNYARSRFTISVRFHRSVNL